MILRFLAVTLGLLLALPVQAGSVEIENATLYNQLSSYYNEIPADDQLLMLYQARTGCDREQASETDWYGYPQFFTGDYHPARPAESNSQERSTGTICVWNHVDNLIRFAQLDTASRPDIYDIDLYLGNISGSRIRFKDKNILLERYWKWTVYNFREPQKALHIVRIHYIEENRTVEMIFNTVTGGLSVRKEYLNRGSAEPMLNGLQYGPRERGEPPVCEEYKHGQLVRNFTEACPISDVAVIEGNRLYPGTDIELPPEARDSSGCL
ncbi:MAG: hypothetical protein KDK27_04525 [Leptospiraceae bacterium]|nr:hypothetical protein [Leptospiraceae bacterium]